MTEHFLSYEQALATKELGFDEPCLSYYEGESFSHHLAMIKSDDDDYITAAPLKSQFFKWVRERYGIHSYIEYIKANNTFELWIMFRRYAFESYEQAETFGINKIIELLKLK